MRRLIPIGVGVLCLACSPAMAQARGDVSAGYRFLKSEGLSYPAGWYVDATGHISSVISIVGDVGGTYKSDSLSFGSFEQSLDARIYTFLGGVRVSASTRDPDVIVFGKALFGAANLRTTTTSLGITLSRTSTEPALSLGGGVDVNDLPIGVRVQMAWLRVFEQIGSNAYHFSIGAKFDF
jgi:hypothetical protein